MRTRTIFRVGRHGDYHYQITYCISFISSIICLLSSYNSSNLTHNKTTTRSLCKIHIYIFKSKHSNNIDDDPITCLHETLYKCNIQIKSFVFTSKSNSREQRYEETKIWIWQQILLIVTRIRYIQFWTCYQNWIIKCNQQLL